MQHLIFILCEVQVDIFFKMHIVSNYPHLQNQNLLKCKEFDRVLHLLPQISMFCVLSQNYQHLFEENMHLTANCPRNSEIASKCR